MEGEALQQSYLRNLISDLTGWSKPKEKLAQAFTRNEFILYSQTILKLGRGGDNRSHIEIFVRLQEEEQNLVPPGTFLPILEAYNLGPLLDRYVLRKVLTWYRARRRGTGFVIHINLCPETLADRKFPGFVAAEVKSRKLAADCVCFEIPDVDDVYDPLTLQIVQKLKEIGCRIVVGSPDRTFVSFQPIKTLNADFLKVGHGLVHSLAQDKMAAAKVRAVIKACREFNVRTIAQHVEDSETLKILKQLGMDYAQGYGISRPQPLETAKLTGQT